MEREDGKMGAKGLTLGPSPKEREDGEIEAKAEPLLTSPVGRDKEKIRAKGASPSDPLHGMEREDEEIGANGGPHLTCRF